MADLTLYLLRHGESTANVEGVHAAKKIDPALTDLGIQQAKTQAEYLKSIRFSAFYSSPLLRAKQTANFVSETCGIEPVFTDLLLETDVGVLDGQKIDDPDNLALYEAIISKWNQRKENAGFPEGETLGDIRSRFSEFVQILKTHGYERVLIVGHSGLFEAAIWLFCPDHGTRLEDGHMKRGRFSIIEHKGDEYRLVKFNAFPEG
jgi:probable phosphoglycerate mutase